jgi:DnaK suppressor protein
MAELDKRYIEAQRVRLLKLREELQQATPAEREEAELTAAYGDEPREAEEEAQRLATLEVDGHLVARDLTRRRRIERALQKIEQGTYGLSDDSGEPIARERLDSMPEAVYSVADEAAREAKSNRSPASN